MNKNRKNYESYLNELHPYYEPFMEYLTTKSQRVINCLNRASYGSMLRKYDKTAFEVGFNEWKNN